MPKVKVQRQSSLSADAAFSKISSWLSSASELKNLDSKYQCDFNEQTKTGQAHGKHFTADLKVAEAGGGCKVEIEVKLPLALGLLKGKVEKQISKKMDEVLG